MATEAETTRPLFERIAAAPRAHQDAAVERAVARLRERAATDTALASLGQLLDETRVAKLLAEYSTGPLSQPGSSSAICRGFSVF